jgi:hypothetical protein
MKTKTVRLAAIGLVVCGALVFGIYAQEGHPMTGSWVGDWGLTPTQRHRVVVIIEWNGSELVGTINPGPDAIPIRTARADPGDWRLHIEAETVDANGGPVRYVIDGAIDDLLAYNRTIAGTWRANNDEGDFSITRQ